MKKKEDFVYEDISYEELVNNLGFGISMYGDKYPDMEELKLKRRDIINNQSYSYLLLGFVLGGIITLSPSPKEYFIKGGLVLFFAIIIYFYRHYEKRTISKQIEELRLTIGYKLFLKNELDKLVSDWEKTKIPEDNVLFKNYREAQKLVNIELSFYEK